MVYNFFKRCNITKCYFYLLSLFKYSWSNFFKSKPIQNLISRFFGISIAYELNKTICIDYLYNGEVYKVYLPFERKLVNKMINDVIEIHYDQKSESIWNIFAIGTLCLYKQSIFVFN